ncbi:MAG: rhodanese-like domain-containing protein [Candidatus Tectomicrobia bacterium]|nr:rhodanese-like domain-containing protein [Candidatus Tectomicrobia bacterium]
MATTSKQVSEIDATTLRMWMDKGDVVLVDVREPAEYVEEHIQGAGLIPLSRFDPARIPQAEGKTVVLYCRTGNRSAQAGQQLLDSGASAACHLQGGIEAWKAAGYETERTAHAPISLQRQVQIVAGLLVLLGTILGVWVSPWFLLLSGFVGAGLTFAGMTNTCGMAMLLAKLPYNQRV